MARVYVYLPSMLFVITRAGNESYHPYNATCNISTAL